MTGDGRHREGERGDGERGAPDGRLGPLVQFALIAGPLLSMLDSSVVNVASVPIARALHTGLGSVQWTVSGYLLALGAGLAATASLARRFGTLAVYRAGIVGFTAASAGCAFAPGINSLITARAVQGLLAAPLVPLAMSMLLGRGGARRAMSPTAGMLLFLGPALGPSVGGLLIGVDLLGAGDGWRLVFLVNLPIGLAAYGAARQVPARLAPGRDPDGARFDLPGLAVLTVGLTALLLGASQGASDGWGSASALVPLLAGLALTAGYVPWSKRVRQPALDLTPAREAGAALALVLCAAASVVTFAALFLLPAFLQQAQGHSALVTGLAMAPQGLLTGVGMALESRLRPPRPAPDRGRRLRRARRGKPRHARHRRRDRPGGHRGPARLQVGLDRTDHQPAADGADRRPRREPARRREHPVQHLPAAGRLLRHRPARDALHRAGRAARPGRRVARRRPRAGRDQRPRPDGSLEAAPRGG